mgnify:CR=1 FL=1
MFILGMYVNTNARLINKQLNHKQTTMTTQQIDDIIITQNATTSQLPVIDFLDVIQHKLDNDPNAEFRLQQCIWEGDYNEYWYEMIHPNQNELYTEHAVFNKVQSWYMEAYA